MNKEEAKAAILSLSKEIDQHNYHYYVESNPQISDYDFDMLLLKLHDLPSFAKPTCTPWIGTNTL